MEEGLLVVGAWQLLEGEHDLDEIIGAVMIAQLVVWL